MPQNGRVRWWALAATLVLSAACSHHRSLEPPDAVGPTAGSCSIERGRVGTVRLGPDFVPQPRCLVVRHDQRLRVVNRSGDAIRPRLGKEMALTIPDGGAVTFRGTVGDHLATGVHRLVFTAASAADIWVDAVCTGGDGADCRNPS
jgi:hypothetical protein